MSDCEYLDPDGTYSDFDEDDALGKDMQEKLRNAQKELDTIRAKKKLAATRKHMEVAAIMQHVEEQKQKLLNESKRSKPAAGQAPPTKKFRFDSPTNVRTTSQFADRTIGDMKVHFMRYDPASEQPKNPKLDDGVVKMWESESGKLVQMTHEHRGWVTDFLYWPNAKVVLSSANDGYIICWGSGGGPVDKILIGVPVYCMTINPRRMQLLCGVNAAIKVYDLDLNRKSHHYVNNQCKFAATEHTDIVRCIVCRESRVYSAGYDQRLIIYDSSYTGEVAMTPIHISATLFCMDSNRNSHAHDAGISCLQLVKDNENNTWILTGSFDKTVKIWTTDGKLVHPPLKNFISTVTGVCFVKQNKTIWAAGGTAYASLYDPKSGDNVSDFIGTFQTEEEEKYQLQLLKYFSEQNQVVASTSRRHLVVWKYNSYGCITALKCRTAVESLAYTKKVPLLIFSGDSEGVITKWERVQSNHFMYSKELFPLSDTKKMKRRKKLDGKGSRQAMLMQQLNKNPLAASRYMYNKSPIPTMSSHSHRNTGILKVIFVEEHDLIISACEDGNIYVWGFDEDDVEVLKGMKPPNTEQLIHKYAVLLDPKSSLLLDDTEHTKNEDDFVTNRVAGFICKHILSEHMSCVTSLAVIGCEHGYDTTYVVSAGWDRRICIWDLEAGCLHDVFRNQSVSVAFDHVELACDGIITDMAFCATRHELAYASSDKLVYLRRFSPKGTAMVLLSTLQGHYAEVTCVTWNIITETWVTGSEDATIRIWSSNGVNDCLQVLDTNGTITALSVDVENGAVIAGIQDKIRVYEPDQYTMVQTNVGHTDAIRSILHIPERKQYVTASWDKTICVWNAWTKKPVKRKKADKDRKGISSMEDDLDLDVVPETQGPVLDVDEEELYIEGHGDSEVKK